MERIITYVLSALLVVTVSCSKHQTDVPERKVAFRPNSAQTKVLQDYVITGTDYPFTENFNVYARQSASTWNEGTAWNDGGLALAGISNWDAAATCTYSGSERFWDSGSHYWTDLTASNYLHALAYSPAGAEASGTMTCSWENGFTFSGYTMPVVGQQYDLMFSPRSYNNAYACASVPLTFEHALSNVVFMVGLQQQFDTHTPVYLHKLSLENVYSTGTYTQGLKTSREATSGTDAEKSPYQTDYPSWSSLSSEQNYVLMEGHEIIGGKGYDKLNPAIYDSNEGWLIQEHAFLPIPQSQEHVSPGQDIVLVVDYAFLSESNVMVDEQERVLLKDVGTGEKGVWKVGKKYIYRVYFTPNSLSVSIKIVPWDDVTNIELH